MTISIAQAAAALKADPSVRALAAVCSERSARAHLIGGAVRDCLLGRPKSHDLDVYIECVEGSLRSFQEAYVSISKKSEFSGALDIAEIDFFMTSSMEVSSGFSDFSINSICYDIVADEIVDRWGGVADLERRLLRINRQAFLVLGRPFFRLFRFAQDLEFRYEPSTLDLFREHRHLLSLCAPAQRCRAMSDLFSVLSHPEGLFLEDLMKSRLLEAFIPMLEPVSNIKLETWNGSSRLEKNFQSIARTSEIVKTFSEERRSKILERRTNNAIAGTNKFHCSFNLLSHVRLALLFNGVAEFLLAAGGDLPQALASKEVLSFYQRRMLQDFAATVSEDPTMKQAVLATLHILELSARARRENVFTNIPAGQDVLFTCLALFELSSFDTRRIPSEEKWAKQVGEFLSRSAN